MHRLDELRPAGERYPDMNWVDRDPHPTRRIIAAAPGNLTDHPRPDVVKARLYG